MARPFFGMCRVDSGTGLKSLPFKDTRTQRHRSKYFKPVSLGDLATPNSKFILGRVYTRGEEG